MVVGAILSAIVATVIIWYFSTRLPANYPPTPPIRLPILGHALYFLWHWPASPGTSAVYEIYRRYNRDGILAIHVGTEKMTVVGTHQLTRNLLGKEETNSRSHPRILRTNRVMRQGHNGEGIIFNTGASWQEQRKFLNNTLRDLAKGDSRMEDLINKEVDLFCESAGDTLAAQINTEGNIFVIPVLNMVWRIVAGTRYDYKDPRMTEMARKVVAISRASPPKPNLTWFVPIVGMILPSTDTYLNPDICDNYRDIIGLMRNMIEQHKETYDRDNVRDFIDAYLLQINEGNNNHGSGFDEFQLLQVLIDIFLAAVDTATNTLLFAVFYMVNNQEVQDKVRQEICEVIGRERQPSLADRKHMPYTEATIEEITRCADVIPEVGRMTTGPVKVGNYEIPPGHMLFASLTAVMQGEDTWSEPHRFDPNRFLEDGRFKKDERVIPFSTGKRQCPGEGVARAEIFLFFVGLLQRFKFEPGGGKDEIEIGSVHGITRSALSRDPIKVTQIDHGSVA